MEKTKERVPNQLFVWHLIFTEKMNPWYKIQFDRYTKMIANKARESFTSLYVYTADCGDIQL